MEPPEPTPEGEPPEDDRNEEVEGSPIPDPLQGDTETEDIPEAD